MRLKSKPRKTLAQRALEINPQLLAAWHLKADIHLANFEPREAAGVLSEALKLHPTDEATLGRLAAAYLATDGVGQRGPDSRFGKLAAAVAPATSTPAVSIWRWAMRSIACVAGRRRPTSIARP